MVRTFLARNNTYKDRRMEEIGMTGGCYFFAEKAGGREGGRANMHTRAIKCKGDRLEPDHEARTTA